MELTCWPTAYSYECHGNALMWNMAIQSMRFLSEMSLTQKDSSVATDATLSDL